MAFRYAIFMLFVLFHLVDGQNDHETYKVCPSCHNVRSPFDCTNFVEIWRSEICTTEIVMLFNGTRVWNFWYEEASLCAGSDFIRTPRTLSGTRRAKVNERSGFVLCHECCDTDLCNHKLCGPSSHNYVLCLNGEETSDRPSVSHINTIAYCGQNQSCFASNTFSPGNSRVKQFGCLSNDVCRQFPATDYHGTCQRCCNTDACNAHLCHEQASDSTTVSLTFHQPTTIPDSTTASSTPTLARDCWDLQNLSGMAESRVYVIYPLGGAAASLRVRCDMTSDGGGWTVLQRRFDGSLNFTRTMSEYEQGFGDVAAEHWIGLNWMHVLTTQRPVQLRVDLSAFDRSRGYAVYDGFYISNRSDTYRLETGTFRTGTLQDKLTYHQGHVFQTTGSCASAWKGGWWYKNCFVVNLNGEPYNGGRLRGIVWSNFGGSSQASLRSSEIMIRPL